MNNTERTKPAMTKTKKQFVNLYTGKPVSRQALNFSESVNPISYISESYPTPKTVMRGAWHGYQYSIQDTGPFPTAHIAVPKGHPLYGVHPKDPILNKLEAHGGVHDTGPIIPRSHGVSRVGRWWISWQYAELSDYLGFYQPRPGDGDIGIKWTEKEILADIKRIILKLDEV